MIVENIVNALFSLLQTLFSFINLPAMPEIISNAFQTFLNIAEYGSSIMNFALPGSVIRPAFSVFAVIFAVDHGYPVIMWVLRKIPMLGIE